MKVRTKALFVAGSALVFGGIYDLIFGCWHTNYSFPITIRDQRLRYKHEASRHTGAYVVCLDCGKEMPYDWKLMKISKEQEHADHAIR
jgi:hypothetical protein